MEFGSSLHGKNVMSVAIDVALRVRDADGTPILGNCHIEVQKVVTVEDHILSIYFSPSDAQSMQEREFVALQGTSSFQAIAVM